MLTIESMWLKRFLELLKFLDKSVSCSRLVDVEELIVSIFAGILLLSMV
jgi:hypothetical protein